MYRVKNNTFSNNAYRVKNNTFSNNAHYMYGQEYI